MYSNCKRSIVTRSYAESVNNLTTQLAADSRSSVASVHDLQSFDCCWRASVIVRLTEEKSLSDCTELAEIHNRRRATSDKSGNSLELSCQKARGVLLRLIVLAWHSQCLVACKFLSA